MMKEMLLAIAKLLDDALSKTVGLIVALRDYTRTQRLFLYSVLATLFLIGYFIVLPRWDCAHNYKAACEYVDRTYQKM